MTDYVLNRWIESSHALLTGTMGGVVASHMQGGTNLIVAGELVFFMLVVTYVYVYMDVYSKPHGKWLANRMKEWLLWLDVSENERVQVEWPSQRAS